MKLNRYVILGLLLVGLLSRCGTPKKTVATNPKPKFEHELLNNNDEDPVEVKSSDSEKESDLEANDLDINSSSTNLILARKRELELFVQEWRGVPHRMGGTTKKGVDCSGFVIVAYRDVLDLNFKSRRAQDIFSEMEPVASENLAYGDLVFFKIKGRRIDHVGIYLGESKFAHASSSRGVMVSSLEQEYFKKRFFKGARHSAI